NVMPAWGINAMIFPGLTVLYELALLVRGKRHPVSIRQLSIPAALFISVVLCVVIQAATWTPVGWHHPICEMAAGGVQRPVSGSVSVNRDLTDLALLRLITSASVLWLAVQLCANTARAHQFMTALVAISVGYAAYGLFAFSMTAPDAGLHRFVSSTFY